MLIAVVDKRLRCEGCFSSLGQSNCPRVFRKFFYVAIKGGGAHGGQAQRFGVADLLGQVQIDYGFKVGRQLYSRSAELDALFERELYAFGLAVADVFAL